MLDNELMYEYNPENDVSYFKNAEAEVEAAFVKSQDYRIKDEVLKSLNIDHDNLTMEDYTLKRIENIVVSEEGIGSLIEGIANKIKSFFSAKHKLSEEIKKYKEKIKELNPSSSFVNADITDIAPIHAVAIKHVNDDLLSEFKKMSKSYETTANKLSITDYDKCHTLVVESIKSHKNNKLSNDVIFQPIWEQNKWFSSKDFSIVSFSSGKPNTAWSFIIPEVEEEGDVNVYNCRFDMKYRDTIVKTKNKDPKFWIDVLNELVVKVEKNLETCYNLEKDVNDLLKKFNKFSWDADKSNGVPKKCLKIKSLMFAASACAMQGASDTFWIDYGAMKYIYSMIK